MTFAFPFIPCTFYHYHLKLPSLHCFLITIVVVIFTWTYMLKIIMLNIISTLLNSSFSNSMVGWYSSMSFILIPLVHFCGSLLSYPDKSVLKHPKTNMEELRGGDCGHSESWGVKHLDHHDQGAWHRATVSKALEPAF